MVPFDRIGGDALRAVIEDFYRRVFDDVMIGFLFAGVDRERLIEREWQFTARMLGSDVPYTGRSMPKAHAHVPILGGHFDRRLQILRETLDQNQVDDSVKETWLGHSSALRAQVTADPDSACNHERAAERLAKNRVLFSGD